MKKLIASLLFIASTSVLANEGITQIDVEYKVIEAKASCQTVTKKDGTSFLKIRFDEDSFARIKELGFKKTRFAKHPREICENGELPKDGEGVKAIKVLLYTADLNSLNDLI